MRKFTKIQFSKINKIFTFFKNQNCKIKLREKTKSTIRNNVISIISTNTIASTSTIVTTSTSTSTNCSNLQRSNNLLNLLMDEILNHINTYNQEKFQENFQDHFSLYSNEKTSLYSNEKISLYSNEKVYFENYHNIENLFDMDDVINLSDFFS